MLFPSDRVHFLAIALALASPALSEAANDTWQEASGYRYRQVVPVSPASPAAAGSATQAGFVTIPSSDSGLTFSNGLPHRLMMENNNFMNGSGVAAGDVDGDGWCDLYFCAINGTNALYHNESRMRFRDVTAASGVGMAGLHSTGATFADVDGDGDLDLLVATLGSGVHLFVNQGRGGFQEMTEAAGLQSAAGSTSLALGDVDGDGDLDLYVANYGALSILRAGGRAEMKKVGNQWVATGPHAKRLRFVDGRLEEVGEPDVLYLNDGRGKFKAVPWNSEFFLDEEGKPKAEPWDYGLTAQIRDINGDGAPDVYVCNDFQTFDRIWINDGRGRFRALPRLAMRKQSFSSMGVDFADLDRDGHLDFMTTEMMSRNHRDRSRQIVGMMPTPPVPGLIDNRPEVARNTLFHSRGDNTYEEVAQQAGVAATDWSWQPLFLDVDLDGYEDLLVVNGMPFDLQDRDVPNRVRSFGPQTPEQSRTNLLLYPPFFTPNVGYRNRGDLTFEEVSQAWGFDSTRISQGAALADFDQDGDLDVAINCLLSEPLLLENKSAAPRLAVRLRGRASNSAGAGSRIVVRSENLPTQSQEIVVGGRYLSGDDPVRVFAAGDTNRDLTIEVFWRSGAYSVERNVRGNRVYELQESSATPAPAAASEKTNLAPWFKDVSAQLGHAHREQQFDDYSRQPLLMKQLSQLGPGAAWFDLDEDGHDELIIGAAKDQRLEVFHRNASGGFQAVALANPRAYPDDLTGLAGWVSADGTRAVLAGLANYESGDTTAPSAVGLRWEPGEARVRIGTFDHLPAGKSSPGPLAVADFDGDGDLDLFIGGRVLSRAYPLAPQSRILRQQPDGLQLDEVNTKVLAQVGMVSGAVWSDLTGDGLPELVLACEWGPLRVFLNRQGSLTEVTSAWGLASLTGWWNGVTTGDFDNDGRMDIVASNWGNNTGYAASPAHPTVLLHSPLPGSEFVDLIEGYYAPDLDATVPRRSLNALGRAFPQLAESFPNHRSYSAATLDAVIGALKAKPERLEATTLNSTVFLNRGERFQVVALPATAQWAPAFAVNVGDADGDGNEDLFLSQNFFDMRAEWERADAGRGLWLRGDGRGGFAAVPGQVSGVRVYGEQRGAALADFNADGRLDLLVTQNGARTYLYENTAAKPGLRVRLKGPRGNPTGIGAIVRLQCGESPGPAHEIHSGSGYWSQDSAVVVLGCAGTPTSVKVTWPGGKTTQTQVATGAREILISTP